MLDEATKSNVFKLRDWEKELNEKYLFQLLYWRVWHICQKYQFEDNIRLSWRDNFIKKCGTMKISFKN